MMDPREIFAHHLKTYREQTGQTMDGIEAAFGVKRNWLCRAENPAKYVGRRSVVSENLEQMLEVIGLTFAPVDDSVPTTAAICLLIDRMRVDSEAKRVIKAAVREAGKLPLMDRKERAA